MSLAAILPTFVFTGIAIGVSMLVVKLSKIKDVGAIILIAVLFGRLSYLAQEAGLFGL